MSSSAAPPFCDPTVAAVFESYPEPLRSRLHEMRNLIFNTAEGLSGVGPIDECLRWGQPSYLTLKTKSGSIIRLDRVKKSETTYALYFHCQTSLVSTFRDLYDDELTFEGNRAILFTADEAPPHDLLSHCISMALTYRLTK